MSYDHISDRMTSAEFNAYRSDIYSLMDRAAGKALQCEIQDQMDREYMDNLTASVRMTDEEKAEYNRLYTEYKEAEYKFLRYKNYVQEKAFKAGLESTAGCKYFTPEEVL